MSQNFELLVDFFQVLVNKNKEVIVWIFSGYIIIAVPPRIPSSRPLISHQYPDRLTLSWMPARVPSYVKSQKLTYIVEVREPPSSLWRSLTDDLRDTEYDVTDLNPEQDYLFRVRAKNEYGLSEPTMPASVIRERGTELSFMSNK